ncbi:hypothetical protein D1AOALGA4SA_3369 [Olavius algarvensis Delta 1 endosymbiont]|nr:hypothetical protein D1AOALGA4SA_3369 [Olavius algarvensis Delta 1 endosymbiont]
MNDLQKMGGVAAVMEAATFVSGFGLFLVLVLDFVQNGLGPKNLVPGGLWILLISWAALRAGGLPKALNYIGLAIGIAGILVAAPALAILGALVWLGFIVWWVWVGIVLLRHGSK